MLAFDLPSRRHHTLLIALMVAALLTCGLRMPSLAQDAAETSTATVGRVHLQVEARSPADANDLATSYGSAITTAWPQFAGLFGAEPAAPQYIAFVNTLDPATMQDMRWITDFAYVSLDGTVAIVAITPFLALTPIEAGNVLRNIVSRGFVQASAAGAMPPGLLDGIARYVETPVLARQARLGSLVQGLRQAGTLPGWDQIVSATAPDLPAETQTANAYALVAFLIERYGVAGLQDLVGGFATTPDWQANLSTAFGQTEADLGAAWEQFLPRWFASGWRDNAVSAFDLSRAETLFARGAYEAASAEAERSQRLFTDLNDQAGLSQVEALLAQCAVGLQADSVMTDAQHALEGHDYAQVEALLGQADALYALLPDEHRAGAIMDQYAHLASDGNAANQHLADAQRLAGSWLAVTSARNDAVAAGDLYASLGDGDGVTAAQQVVNDIDSRIQRMLFTLSALVIVLGAWLAAWMWHAAPGRLRWRARHGHARTWQPEAGGD